MITLIYSGGTKIKKSYVDCRLIKIRNVNAIQRVVVGNLDSRFPTTTLINFDI